MSQIHPISWDQNKESEVDSGRGSGPGHPEAPPPTLRISPGNISSMSQPRRLCLAPSGWRCPQLSPGPGLPAPLSPNSMIQLARFHRPKSQTHARLPPGNCPPEPQSTGVLGPPDSFTPSLTHKPQIPQEANPSRGRDVTFLGSLVSDCW